MITYIACASITYLLTMNKMSFKLRTLLELNRDYSVVNFFYSMLSCSYCAGTHVAWMYLVYRTLDKVYSDYAFKAHNMSEGDVVNKVMLLKQAVKEFVSVETLGQMALLLASETAGTITGTAIPIDGGWNAQ